MKLDFQREEALFNAASELESPSERAAFLARECADDGTLRQRVETLLNSVAPAQKFFARPFIGKLPDLEAPARAARVHPELRPGEWIGPYRLLEKLGEGGFGAVYVAEQTRPVRRRVALKVIKAGMDTREVMARFDSEQQALALMDHPNIAHVLDAGATESGRPYFVMELVHGEPITQYCDRKQMDIQQRVALFIEVCRGVQHAHQKGVIHRDLKPSNILVVEQDEGVLPKVIDFGIAKATEGRLTDATLFTLMDQLIGTPAYMSPEQAESPLNIDTRTDIYSLGVVLYELLSGTTPFTPKELVSSGIETMRRTLRDQEPPRPSTRARSLAEGEITLTAHARLTDPAHLIQQLQGDLDWIVMKCLEKDRARRYATANGLALDLQRQLDNEPILARPPSTFYRVQKAWRRNRLIFAGISLIALLLVLGAGTSTWLMLDARQAQHEANQARLSEEQHRRKAELSQQAAEAEQERADLAARQAAAREQLARHLLYAADMKLAQQALLQGNLSTTREFLNRHRPATGEEDLRGWEWRYLWQQSRSRALRQLGRKPEEIRELAADRSGPWVAVQAGNHSPPTLYHREIRGLTLPLELPGPEFHSFSRGIAFSPDGGLFAMSAHGDEGRGVITLHELEIGRTILTLPVAGRTMHLAISQDGQRLLCLSRLSEATRMDEVSLWSLQTGGKIISHDIRTTYPHEGVRVAVAADLNQIAYICSENDGRTIKILNLADGVARTTETAADAYQSVALSPDGRLMAAGQGGSGRSILLWQTSNLTPIGTLEGHRLWINALTFWPDSSLLASASGDGTIRLWDLASMTPAGQPLIGHEAQVWQLALVPGRSLLVSGGSEGAILLWDVNTLRSEAEPAGLFKPDPHPSQLPEHFYGRASAWAFTPDAQAMFTCAMNGRIRRWSGPGFSHPTDWLDVGSNTFRVVFSEDCRWVATSAESGGQVAVWDLQTRQLKQRLPRMDWRALPEKFTPDGDRLFVRYRDHDSMHEWDLRNSAEVRQFSWKGPPEGTRDRPFAFSQDSRWCLTLDWDGAGRLRDLHTGPETSFPSEVPRPVAAAFSPDGRFFAMANSRDFVRLWRTAPLSEVAVFRGFLMGVTALAFSPDSRRLAISSRWDDAVKIYDVSTGQEMLTLKEQGTIHFPFGFSPDGNVLAGSNGLLARILWRVPSWEEISAAEGASDLW